MARARTLELRIARPPERVRAWWCDLPEEHVVARREGEVDLRTRFGLFPVRETFRASPDGSWGFTAHAPFGIEVRDRFEPAAEGDGTRLRITYEVDGRHALGRALAALYGPLARWQFERIWREAARTCEREA